MAANQKNITKYQKEICMKYNNYFRKRLNQLPGEQLSAALEEYDNQVQVLLETQKITNPSIEGTIHKNNIIYALSEPKTHYYLNDYVRQPHRDDKLYSPQIDMAFSPVIEKRKRSKENIGNYALTEDVYLYHRILGLDFVRELAEMIQDKSRYNYTKNHLRPQIGDNKRPLHLFGFEIEMQANKKHLMGDFLNVVSLSLIPTVLVPEEKLDETIKMLLFSSIISDVKGIKIYDSLSKCNILSIEQFTEMSNKIFLENNIERILTVLP